jgi:hypothetical protein
MAKEVWMIGVDPPCPRCDLTQQRVERISKKMGGFFKIKKLIYSDADAKKFGESIGKEIGTGRHVAEKAGIDMGWQERFRAVAANPPSRPEDFDEIDGIARMWSPEMDELLRPCQEKAESVGMLMTPILVVDGEVKHHGSVPSLEQLRSWLT